LRLVDSYEVRNEILALLQRHSTTWFDAAMADDTDRTSSDASGEGEREEATLDFVNNF